MVPSKDDSYQPLTGKSSSAAPSAPPTPFFHSFVMSRSANSNRNTREQGGAGGILSTHLDSVESVIDSGFPVVQEFERGIVDFVQGSQSTVDLSELQEPITTSGKLIGFIGSALACSTLIGIPYVLSCITLVKRGEIALLQSYDGSMRVLGEGLHSPLLTFACSVRKAKMTENCIQSGIISILRVTPGNVGLGLSNGIPKVLLPGMHVVNDPLFEYKGSASMTDLHISVGCVHLITVPMGQVGLCSVNSTPHFLEQGRHHINNQGFRWLGFHNSTDEHIACGSKHRVIVPNGKLGLAWDCGQAVILEPQKVYNIDSPTWSYVNSVPITTQVIYHGGIKVVTVREGFAGISFDDGKMVVLTPGRHMLTKTTHVFSGFLSTGQQTLSIAQVTSMSSDNVGLRFDAAITVQVTDPSKAVTMLANLGGDSRLEFDPKNMYTAIVQKAKIALAIIVGNNRLNNPKRVKTIMGDKAQIISDTNNIERDDFSPRHAEDDPVDEGSFKQVVHDTFLNNFATSMSRDCGVNVVDFSVEDVQFTDPELATALARGAVARTDLVKAEIDLQVKRTMALAEQQGEILRAQGKAQAIAILAEAEASRIKKVDQAMNSVCAATQQRELVLAASQVMENSSSALILANSIGDVSNMLGASMLSKASKNGGLLN
jgi:regulator of protease activity HflC (stomatin/prohibitin superfamily)